MIRCANCRYCVPAGDGPGAYCHLEPPQIASFNEGTTVSSFAPVTPGSLVCGCSKGSFSLMKWIKNLWA